MVKSRPNYNSYKSQVTINATEKFQIEELVELANELHSLTGSVKREVGVSTMWRILLSQNYNKTKLALQKEIKEAKADATSTN